MIDITEELVEKFGRKYPADTVIFSEYERGEEFFMIVSGKVKIVKLISGMEKIIDILGPGDIFGEMALLENAPRSASAITETDSILLVFNRRSFEGLFKASSQLAYKLLVILSKRIYDARRRLSILVFDDPLIRVADVIVMLAEKKYPNYNELRTLELDTTINDIASWAALDIEKCKKAVITFIRMGRLEVMDKKIIVKNLGDFIRLVSTKRKEILGKKK